MKLISIKLTHFRQFYGQQQVNFSTDPVKNVTLFHAENGVGKTTLLNALLWCFYGQDGVTEKFDRSNDIVSYQAVAEKIFNARVEVSFEQDDRIYSAARSFRADPGRRPEESLVLFEIADGNAERHPLPEVFINSVIPREMAHHYFFDGEHAENFASPENFRDVGAAIRNMLGSTIADCAIDDLKYVSRQLGEELSSLPGEERIQQISRELQQQQKHRESSIAQVEQQERNVATLKEQIALIDAQLADSRIAKDLQRQRSQYEAELARAGKAATDAEREVVRWIGRKAISVIANRLSEETLQFIEEQKERGKIPSPYNEELVHQLLKDELCICGRPLEPGSECFSAVQNLLRKAGNADVVNRAMLARGRVTVLKETRIDAAKELARYQKERASAFDAQRLAEQNLAFVSQKLASIDQDQIDERERARIGLNAQIADANQKIGANRLAVMACDRRIDELTRQERSLAASNAKALRIVNRKTLAETASKVLAAILAAHEDEAKTFIAKEINAILATTARRKYRFLFTDGFTFDLTFENGQTVPRSSGENQLLSLAFIAALIKFCKERSQQKEDPLLIPGIVAPLVLDSPFGQLDNTYRIDTAKFIPAMAEQVALFVSSSQGSNEVISALEGRVGQEYILVSENVGPRDGRPSDVLQIRGRSYERSVFMCPKNQTRIEAIQ